MKGDYMKPFFLKRGRGFPDDRKEMAELSPASDMRIFYKFFKNSVKIEKSALLGKFHVFYYFHFRFETIRAKTVAEYSF